MPSIVTIIGARPQFIKAATVSRAVPLYNEKKGHGDKLKEVMIHTGQHYDDAMSKIFFDELQIPKPEYNLGIGSDSHARQTGKMLSGIEEILLKEKPDMVLTYGDTNSTLAGTLAASKLQILSAHVEAGLRSYNRRMPEEVNRVLADEISNLLFCPTETALENLRREGIVSNQSKDIQTLDFNDQWVVNVGDVMYDSILYNKNLAAERSDILLELGLLDARPDRDHVLNYCVATVHRPENTDNPKKLSNILEGLNDIASKGMRVLFPIHPRTQRCMGSAGLSGAESLHVDKEAKKAPSIDLKTGTERLIFLEPVSYLDMIQLAGHAKAVFTDSGGVQKEAFMLKVPCITLRSETEWDETIQAGWNILTGANQGKMRDAFTVVSKWGGEGPPFQPRNPKKKKMSFKGSNPYGDGRAAERIIETVSKLLCA